MSVILGREEGRIYSRNGVKTLKEYELKNDRQHFKSLFTMKSVTFEPYLPFPNPSLSTKISLLSTHLRIINFPNYIFRLSLLITTSLGTSTLAYICVAILSICPSFYLCFCSMLVSSHR